jgi:hypothetical protein
MSPGSGQFPPLFGAVAGHAESRQFQVRVAPPPPAAMQLQSPAGYEQSKPDGNMVHPAPSVGRVAGQETTPESQLKLPAEQTQVPLSP